MSKSSKKRVLVAYSTSSTFNSSTYEYLMALKNFSEHDVSYVNVTHGAILDFDINDYDVLFQSYCARLCYDDLVSQDYQQTVARFRGLKIASVQDDYDRTSKTHQGIRRLGFHALITIIPKEFWPIVYPKSEIPGVNIYQALTGYVPSSSVARETPPLAERKLWMAYRGNDTSARYGKLGFEKVEIGRRMKELCLERNIPHDIATDTASRIYGDAWFDFLGSSRTMLGSESGSNAVDFDMTIERTIESFVTTHNRQPSYAEMKDFIEPFEGQFQVGQISSRIFEYAAMRTPAVLFRGKYSGAIEADTHYIPLEKDFSNAEQVLSKLDDIPYLQGFADRAYNHLVKSGNFTHRTLARLIDGIIGENYSTVIDQATVDHRRRIAPKWSPLIKPTIVRTNEDAAILALSEVPTELPLPQPDFFDRQKALYEFKKQIPLDVMINFNLLTKSGFGLLAKSAWRMLPKSIRYSLGPKVTG